MKPYETKGQSVCIGCGNVFDVHDDFMVEARCLPCQVQFRIRRAVEYKENPVLRAYERYMWEQLKVTRYKG